MGLEDASNSTTDGGIANAMAAANVIASREAVLCTVRALSKFCAEKSVREAAVAQTLAWVLLEGPKVSGMSAAVLGQALCDFPEAVLRTSEVTEALQARPDSSVLARLVWQGLGVEMKKESEFESIRSPAMHAHDMFAWVCFL